MRRTLALLAAACALAGCERTMKDMYVQPKLGPDRASPLFADGKGSRPPPRGSVPQDAGVAAAASGGRRGAATLDAQEAEQARQALPARPPRAMLVRGQQRYAVYCLPCHSPVGDGDGRVAQRGFPHPPSYHIDRLRTAPVGYFYDVITRGFGVMPSYASQIPPGDRWAIVAYVRALERSQIASNEDQAGQR